MICYLFETRIQHNIPNLLLINRCKLEEGKKIFGGRLAGAPPGIDNPCPQGYLLFITVAFLEFSEGDSDTIIISSSGGTGNKPRTSIMGQIL